MTAIVDAFDGLKRRWTEFSPRTRVLLVLGPLVGIYLALWIATGRGQTGLIREWAPLGIVGLGVVYGTVTALGAIGIILVYRANRFINFAHGALGSMVGVFWIGLVLEHGLSYWIALPAAVVNAALVGALTEFLIIRRFQNASRLVLTVASIGLAQVFGFFELLGSLAIKFVALEGGFNAPLDVTFKLDVRTFAGDEVLIIAIVPVVIAGLAWFLLKTDAGIGVRAAAENVDRALLLGIPVRRLSTIVWLIAGALAALTFMLQAPFAGIKPGVAANGPTVLLPLLAAAIIARMESLPTAVGAGIGLGIMEQVVRWNNPRNSSVVYVVYLGVILAALILQRGKLSRAQEGAGSSWNAIGVVKPTPIELRHLPEVRYTKAAILTILTVLFVLVPRSWEPQDQLLAAFAIVWALIAVSLVVLTGWGGNISLGQFGIAGIAGMVTGNVVSNNDLDFFIVMMIAGAVGGLVSLLVGIPALRIKGLFLAVTTLAFAIALDTYILNQTTFPQFVKTDVSRPLIWERFDASPFTNPDGGNYVMYVTCLVFLALAILAAVGVRKARSGRVLIGTRDNERAADSASVPTSNTKLSGFLLAGVIAGVAGALNVYLVSALSVGTFDPVSSITVFSTAVIGGLGSISGAVLGVLLFRFLQSLSALKDVNFGSIEHLDLTLFLTGGGLLVVLYALPGGLGQLLFSGRDRLLRKVAERRGILVPSLVADKRADDEDKPADEVDLLRGALGGAERPEREPAGVGS